MSRMEPFVLAFIAIGLLIVLVFIIYLVDRVNAIEKETRLVAQSLNGQKEPPSLGPFAGLSSKKLWDAMTGRVPEGMDPSVLVEVRERYELVLQKHIEAIFQEGVKDGQRGLTGEPKNTKLIATLRGPVESWLPSAQVNTLYKCGIDSTQSPPEQWDAVRSALDEAGQLLYSKALINQTQALSMTLWPQAVAQPSAQAEAQTPSLPPAAS
ncbi:hypothetical protein [Limnohabitans sp.]|uniref:hypothetical protein n=1 Tax=Limnohabitans sp. TaxID=1907725 RepID=UPI0037BFB16D